LSEVSITVLSAATCAACGVPLAAPPPDGPRLCGTCRPATAHPVADGPLRTWPLLLGVAQLIEGVGARAALAAMAAQLPAAALAAGGAPIAAAMAAFLGLIVGAGLVTALALEEVGTPGAARLATAAPTVARRLPVLLGASLLSSLFVALLSLLCVVPGVVRALSYTLVLPLAIHGEHDVMACLRASRIRMHGHRAGIFVAVLLLWIVGLAVGIVHSIAVDSIALFQGGVARSLAGAPPLLQVVLSLGPLLTGLAWVPATLLSVVVWARLQARRG
jgi:hypothetical protein